MRVESRARSRALQALYAWDMRSGTALDRVAQQVWDDLAVSREEQDFARFLVDILIARGSEIDKSLSAVTTNWRLSRIGAIERSVLRLAIAELLQGTTPARVVIKESVRLAERYGSSQSARFVNGVLDAYARQQGML
jgi:N utilization substance protein B